MSSPPKDEATPVFRVGRPQDELDIVLEQLQAVVNRYPIAVKAAVTALAAEGRSYAETDEGARWKVRLRTSPLVERLRTIWEAVTEQAFDPTSPEILPSQFLERLVRSATQENLEAKLGRFFAEKS